MNNRGLRFWSLVIVTAKPKNASIGLTNRFTTRGRLSAYRHDGTTTHHASVVYIVVIAIWSLFAKWIELLRKVTSMPSS